MSHFILAVAAVSIILVGAQFLAYFNRRESGCGATADGEPKQDAEVGSFGTGDGSAEAGAPSE